MKGTVPRPVQPPVQPVTERSRRPALEGSLRRMLGGLIEHASMVVRVTPPARSVSYSWLPGSGMSSYLSSPPQDPRFPLCAGHQPFSPLSAVRGGQFTIFVPSPGGSGTTLRQSLTVCAQLTIEECDSRFTSESASTFGIGIDIVTFTLKSVEVQDICATLTLRSSISGPEDFLSIILVRTRGLLKVDATEEGRSIASRGSRPRLTTPAADKTELRTVLPPVAAVPGYCARRLPRKAAGRRANHRIATGREGQR